MAAAVYTVAKPADRLVQNRTSDNIKVKYIQWTSDTGDYAAGGRTFTAAELGLKHITFACADGFATQGTAGAGAVGVGFIYNAAGTSFTAQLYEAAATGLPFLEKGAEAMIANFTVRIKVEGY
jgi:hypothetical protein